MFCYNGITASYSRSAARCHGSTARNFWLDPRVKFAGTNEPNYCNGEWRRTTTNLFCCNRSQHLLQPSRGFAMTSTRGRYIASLSMGAAADDLRHQSCATSLAGVTTVAVCFYYNLRAHGIACAKPTRKAWEAATGVTDGEPATWEAVLKGWSFTCSWRLPATPLLLFPAGFVRFGFGREKDMRSPNPTTIRA